MLQLTQILGNSSHKIQLVNYAQDCLIYTSGSIIVFYNSVVDQQICYLRHISPYITCIAVSHCERYIGVCSSTSDNRVDRNFDTLGKKTASSIYLYDLSQLGVCEPKLLIVLKGHKDRIDQGLFSPDGRYFVSVCNTDGSMFTWNCETGQRLTQNRNSKNINSIKFAPIISQLTEFTELVTVSRGTCKLWSFYNTQTTNKNQLIRIKQQDQWILTGRTVFLNKKFATKQFTEVCFWQKYMLLLTNDGLLCMVVRGQKEQKFQKCIDLMMSNVGGMDILDDKVMCCGQNSVVKVIDLQSLSLVKKFPKPPPSKKQNIQKDSENSQLLAEYNDSEQFPFCEGVKVIGKQKFQQFIITLYSNMTIFIWRPDPHEYIAMRSIISHQGNIPNLSIIDQMQNDLTFFGTISTDNTLRIWHIYNRCMYNRESIDIAQMIGIKRNVYCRNLTRIIYMDCEKKAIALERISNRLIGCIAGAQVLVYSLVNFELVCHQILQEQACVLGVRDEIVYIGLGNKKIILYQVVQVQGRLHKQRQICLDHKIKTLKIANDTKSPTDTFLAILTSDTNQLLVYSLKSSKITHKQKQIQSLSISGPNILISRTNTISLYNPYKNKLTYLISLKHQLTQNEQIISIYSNQIYMALVTNYNKIIIVNDSPTIIETLQYWESINDMGISLCGQFVIVGGFGNIGVWKVKNLYENVGEGEEVNKWVGKDMSWMEGSVWANRKNSSVELGDKLPGTFMESIRLKNSISNKESIHMQLPNMQIKYKNQSNDHSVFNPADILQQAKNIYQNIHVIEKKMSNNSHTGQKNKEIKKEQDQLQEIRLSGMINTQSKPPIQESVSVKSKKRIFGLGQAKSKSKLDNIKFDEEQVSDHHPFHNNLVSSIIHEVDRQQTQLNISMTNEDIPIFQQKGSENQSRINKSLQKSIQDTKLLMILQEKLQSEQFVKNNEKQLTKILSKLSKKLEIPQRNKSSHNLIKQQFKRVSREFLKFLEKAEEQN